MIPIPEWAKEIVHTSVCIPCNHIYRDADVIGFGMRHVCGGKVVLTVICRCPRCHNQENLAVLRRPMDIRAFVAEIAELGGIEDYRRWAHENATLRFYADPPPNGRINPVHHIHTDGEGWSDPRVSELRLCTKLVPTGVVMRVSAIRAFSIRRWIKTETELQVLGGYACSDATIVLCRMEAKDVRSNDGLLKLLPNGRVLQKGFDLERLEPSDWSRFAALPTAAVFRLDGRMWSKLGVPALSAVIGEEVWTLKAPSSKK